MDHGEETTGRGVAALVFGILAVTGTCPCLGAILAILLGWEERSGIGRAGFILGWVALVLQLGVLLLALLWIAIAGAAAGLNLLG